MNRTLYTFRKLLINILRLRSVLLGKVHQLFTHARRTEHILTIIAAIVIGILGALGAIGFRYFIKYSHEMFWSFSELGHINLMAIPWYKKLLLPAIGGLLVGPIVHFLSKEVRGSGIPEVMESVSLHGGIIRLRVLITKAIAAAITIGSGGSAGREGPIVHIGSAIGSAFGQFVGISAKKMRTFVACGAAAGIAATFNAPIAGALFAVEVIIGDFAVPLFSPIVISSVVATVLSRHYIGDFPAFNVPEYELVSAVEFIPYSILGIAAGLIAVLFITSLYKSRSLFLNWNIPNWLKPSIGGFIVGTIAVFLPQILGVGYESINEALWGKDVKLLLVLLIFAKIFATSATLGAGGSGGIFAPSLFIGAMLGALIGQQAHIWFPDITANAGAYALVGMGAVVSATTHAPITAILMIFELTNDYRIIPPLMLACIVSVLLSTYLKKESIYTMKLAQRGIHIFEGKDINVLKKLQISSILNKDVETVNAAAKFPELVQKMIYSHHHIFLVVNKQHKLLGLISFDTIKEFLLEQESLSQIVIAADLMQPAKTLFYPTDNLDLAMHQFGKINVDEFPVVDGPQTQILLGSVRQMDLIDAYNRQIFHNDLAGGMHSIMSLAGDRNIEISDGYHIMEVEPPSMFINKSLKFLNLRAKYEVEIIMIHHSQENQESFTHRPGSVPKPDSVIKPGDKLLLLGTMEKINKFQSAE